MTTRLDLRTLCRRRLGDESMPYHQSDLQINQWINDAIADYSISFPCTLASVRACDAGERALALPDGFRWGLQVVYPLGKNPPRLLARRSSLAPSFYRRAGLYDIRRLNLQSPAATLILSETPEAGEQVEVTYLADHAWLDDDGDVCTLPDRHLELLVLFVRWKSVEELASTEMRVADPSTLAMSTLDTNAMRCERIYRQALRATIEVESDSGIISWRMDRWEGRT